MNEPTPEQLAKLPKWAQLAIREGREAKEALTAYLDTQTKSNVFVRNDVHGHKFYITTERINFQLSKGEVEVHNRYGEELVIRGIYDIAEFVVLPRSSNVFTVRIQKEK